MKEWLIMGVDISKSTLDIFIKPTGVAIKIVNDLKSFRKWFALFKKKFSVHQVLVIMEHTGRYSYQFEMFLRSKKIGYCKIAALQIKRSLG